MVLAAIALWLAFALLFWCMMIGASRGDLQLEAAMGRAQTERFEKPDTVAEAPEQEPLSNAA